MKISELFYECGSDKSHPTEHSYGDFYDHLVGRFQLRSVLEVGVEAGYSMAAWKKLLPEALVIGLDKDVTPEDSISKLNPVDSANLMRDKVKRNMLRHGDVFPPYDRVPGLDVIRCCVPDFSEAIARFRSAGVKFDLIIDDASHTENDQVLTYHYLKEFLSDSGVFVIEDIQNDETISRLKNSGWEIVDLRELKGRWDDVIAFRYAKDYQW